MLAAEAVTDGMAALVRHCVDRRRGLGRKRAIAEFARRAGLPESRVAQFYYRKVRAPLAHELLRLMAAKDTFLADDREQIAAELQRLEHTWNILVGGLDAQKSRAAGGLPVAGHGQSRPAPGPSLPQPRHRVADEG